MKFYLCLNGRMTSIIKDVLFIVLAFVLFSFIDDNFAKYVALFCTSILLIRRIILDLNPLHGQKMHVVYNGKQLSLPENVEIFELNDSASFETLWRYVEALKFISTPPKILIVRFIQQIHIDKASAQIICEVVKHLSEIKVTRDLC